MRSGARPDEVLGLNAAAAQVEQLDLRGLGTRQGVDDLHWTVRRVRTSYGQAKPRFRRDVHPRLALDAHARVIMDAKPIAITQARTHGAILVCDVSRTIRS